MFLAWFANIYHRVHTSKLTNIIVVGAQHTTLKKWPRNLYIIYLYFLIVCICHVFIYLCFDVPGIFVKIWSKCKTGMALG